MKTKSQIKRIIVVFMATTVALTGLAVGYGHWQDQLDVSVVTTTTVGDFTCFGFVDVTTDDPGPPYGYVSDHTVVSPIYWNDGDTYGWQQPIKNVGWTDAVAYNEDGECGGELIEVTVENGYPSYASVTTVGFKNYGPDTAVEITGEGMNLPSELTSAGYYLDYYSPATTTVQHAKCYWLRKLVGPEGWANTPDPGGFQGIDDDRDGSVDEDPMDGFDNDGDGLIDEDPGLDNGADDDGDGLIDEDPAVLDLCWINYEGEILQPTDTTIGALKLHVLQPAEQNQDYSFNVWVEVWPY